MKTPSLAAKLLVAFLLVALVPLGGFGLYVFYKDREDSAVDAMDQMNFATAHLCAEIDKHVAVNQNLVKHLAATREVIGFMAQAERTRGEVSAFCAWLETQRKLSPDFGAIYTMDPNGLCVATSRRDFLGSDFGFRDYFKEAIAGRYYKSDWAIGSVSGEPGFFVSAPVMEGGRTLGVIAIKVYVQRIQSVVSELASEGRSAFVINPMGIILAHSRPEFVYKSLWELTPEERKRLKETRQFTGVEIKSIDLDPALRTTFAEANQGTPVKDVTFLLPGEKRHAVLLKAGELPWIVGVSLPEESIYRKSWSLLEDTLIASLAALCAAALLGLLMSRRFTAPITALSRTMKAFGGGDVSARAKTARRDEIGQLSASFNAMAETIEQYTKMLESWIAERTAELEEERARLDVSLRAARMAVYSYDVPNACGVMDRQFAELLGIDYDTFGGTIEEFYANIHPADKEVILAALKRTKEEHLPYRAEYRAVWPDGSVHYLTTRGELFLDEKGEPSKIRGVTWEETDKKLAEIERDALMEKLHQSHKMEALGTLAGGIAHDFNNILSAVLGYAELTLETVPKNSAHHENMREIIIASHRAKELVREILSFSRKTSDSVQSIHLEPILKEAVKLLRKTVPATIDIVWEPGAGHAPPALANPTQVHQVAMNLGTNAYHALAEKGGGIVFSLAEVTVDGAKGDKLGMPEGRYVCLQVGDNGPGIPEEIVGKIFDPFFTTKPLGMGTGLGLSVVHGVAKNSGGGVEVETAPGVGTTFSVYFPASEEAHEEAESLPPKAMESLSGSVLIVDDEQPLAKLAAKSLARRGLKTRYCTTPEEALSLLVEGRESWDLLVTDQTMPGLTGMEVLTRLRENGVTIPVVVCTGHSDMLEHESALAMGFFAYLRKPLSQSELFAVIERALGKGA